MLTKLNNFRLVDSEVSSFAGNPVPCTVYRVHTYIHKNIEAEWYLNYTFELIISSKTSALPSRFINILYACIGFRLCEMCREGKNKPNKKISFVVQTQNKMYCNVRNYLIFQRYELINRKKYSSTTRLRVQCRSIYFDYPSLI